MNKVGKAKRSLGHVMLDIVIVILCVIFVGAVIFTIVRFREDWNFSYDADSFYYRLQDEDFAQLVEMYYTNEAAGIEADEELLQYYGVARYFEAASYYKVYQEANDEERQKMYLEEMSVAKEIMGELEFLSETICEKLEVK